MAKMPGMAISADLLRPDLWVAEIVYFPLLTELVRTARPLGSQRVDSSFLDMLKERWRAVRAKG